MQWKCQTFCMPVYSSSELAENGWWQELLAVNMDLKKEPDDWYAQSHFIWLASVPGVETDSWGPPNFKKKKYLIESAIHWNGQGHLIMLLNPVCHNDVIDERIQITEADKQSSVVSFHSLSLCDNKDLEIRLCCSVLRF